MGSDFAVDNGQLVEGLNPEVLRVCTSQMALSQAHRPIVEKCGVLGQGSDPRQAAKSLTLTLASYLADFVAGTLRASRTPQGVPLTDEENIHLLGADFWVQPICQEHAAFGHNVSGDGERKPCSGLVKIVAKPRRAKTRVPAFDTASVADWIGGHWLPT